MLSIQVLNTNGAARRLGCSETWIHKLASTGKLKAYIYGGEGELIEHEKESKRQGRALYFLADDVAKYRPAVQRRPRGSKNRYPLFLKPMGINVPTIFLSLCTFLLTEDGRSQRI